MDLRSLRQKESLTIAELSNKLKISERRIKLIERGLDAPTLNERRKITRFFQVDLLEAAYYKNRKRELVAGEGYVTSKQSIEKTYEPKISQLGNKLKVLDLFCGIGGLSYGFEQTSKYVTMGGVDLLRDRIDTFMENHQHAYGFCNNINNLSPKTLSEIIGEKPNIIVGGAPCQGFSSIRPFRNLNENDQRNDLFRSFALYIKNFKPDWFVFENVVGLLTHKDGKTLKVLISEFNSIGYNIDYKILNSAYYGVPQLRERFVLVGNRHGISFNWPEPTHYYEYKSMAGVNKDMCILPSSELQHAINIMEALTDLPIISPGETSNVYRCNPLTEYQHYLRDDCDNLTLHEATMHSEKMMNIIRNSGYNIDAVRHLVTSGFSTSYSRLEPNKPSVTLTVNFTNPSSNKCIHPTQDRALTPREGARLQGFPDKFKFKGTKTQIVKQIGNAVPPILSRVIAEQIYTYY